MTEKEADEKVKKCIDQWSARKRYAYGYVYLGSRIGLGMCCAEVRDDGTSVLHALGDSGSRELYATY